MKDGGINNSHSFSDSKMKKPVEFSLFISSASGSPWGGGRV